MFKTTLLILALVLSLGSNAQENPYVQSGYTSLTIKFSGNYPKVKQFSTPQYGTTLSSNKPTKFETLNDSTLLLTFYTFGVSRCMFTYSEKYYLALLLPNQSDTLVIQHTDTINYSMRYHGQFREIFDQSKEFYEITKKGLASDHFYVDTILEYKSPQKYKEDILDRIYKLTNYLYQDVPAGSLMRKLVEVSTENHYKKALLLDEYPQTFLLYTRGKNLKSTDDTDHITARDISYYDGVITKDFADTSRYFVAHFDLLSKISQDTLLHLPEIGKAGIQNYLARLRVLFGYIFDGHNLFYDMMVATAYINEIENGQFLSASSKSDIIRYFKNRHLSNYILYQNTIYSLKNNKKPSGEHFFSFPGNEDDVLNHILERYSGKIVIMDFWATWCGPCIQAFEQNKEIKNRFKDNDNVVFVYMTGESSDQSKWREYVETVGGEHFYLYDNQLATIFQRHGITSIPSYLLFDKSGTLRKKITGSLTNKEIIEWIEATLTE